MEDLEGKALEFVNMFGCSVNLILSWVVFRVIGVYSFQQRVHCWCVVIAVMCCNKCMYSVQHPVISNCLLDAVT
jgi:hypothetical protein